MLRIFTGEDRVEAIQEIEKLLGKEYEIIDGADIEPADLPNIFFGSSLFSARRKILIRDLSENKLTFEKLPDYLNTDHTIILLETKLDKRSNAYKILKGKVEIRDFVATKDPNLNLVFGIYDTAKKDGKKAIETFEKIKPTQDPIMFFGLLASKALKDYEKHQGIKEKRVLKELSKLDLNLKTTSFSPWLLIATFLLRLSSL